MPIFIIKWVTESGDSGLHGYWAKELTKQQMESFMRSQHPAEFEGDNCYIQYYMAGFYPLE